MSNLFEPFRTAREAAVLIPSEIGLKRTFDSMPVGSVLLCPLTEDGEMHSSEGRLYFLCFWSLVSEDGPLTFSELLDKVADLTPSPGQSRGVVTCRPREIKMAALYDLDRRILTSLILPSELEDWTEEDREDLLPEPLPNGCRDAALHRRIATLGVKQIHARPYIAQLRTGQVWVTSMRQGTSVVYDHDDPKVVDLINGINASPAVRRRIFGRPSEKVDTVS